MTLVDRITAERRRQGLSLRALARRSGLAASTVQRIEAGTLDPTLSTVQRLLEALGLSVEVSGGGRVPQRAQVLEQSAAIRRAASSCGVHNVRLVGSVARGDAGPGSDVDLLVDVEAGRGLLAVEQFRARVEELIGQPIDVITSGAVRGSMRSVLADAVVV